MELPKVNEELKNFFLPRKYVAPEPEVVPEVRLSFKTLRSIGRSVGKPIISLSQTLSPRQTGVL